MDPNDDDDFIDKLDVANMSLGGMKMNAEDPLEIAVESAVAIGITYCVAAGNDGSYFPMGSPASAPSAITVGAVYTDEPDAVTHFSSVGPSGFTYELKPDIVAPGSPVNSTYPGDTYEQLGGTSMSAPMISGVAALLKKLHPGWTPASIKSAIMSTAKDLGDNRLIQGTGLVNAYKAAKSHTLLSRNNLNFGFNSVANTGTWSKDTSVWIYNISGETHSYQFYIPDPVPGVNFTFSNENFSLDPGDSILISVTIETENSQLPTDLNDVIHNLLTYTGGIKLISGVDSLQLSWGFNKGILINLESDGEISLFIAYNDKGFAKSDMAPFMQKTGIIVPNEVSFLVGLNDSIFFNDPELSDDANPWMNFANRFILKDLLLGEGDSIITFNLSEANNKIIFHTENEDGDYLPEDVTSHTGFGIVLTDSMYIDISRFAEKDTRPFWLIMLSTSRESTGHTQLDYFNFMSTRTSDDLWAKLDTFYISDLAEDKLIAGGQVLWNNNESPDAVCFASFEGRRGLNTDIITTTSAEDYKPIYYRSTNFFELDWTPRIYWERNTEVLNSIFVGDDYQSGNLDIFMPDLPDKDEEIFYNFRLQNSFSYLFPPLRNIEGKFIWGEAHTPDKRIYQPGDTITRPTGIRWLKSSLTINKDLNLICPRLANVNEDNTRFPSGTWTELINSSGDTADYFLDFYFIYDLEPDIYTASLWNSSYKVFRGSGRARLKVSFNTASEDAGIPSLNSIRFTNKADEDRAIIAKGDTTELLFSLADFDYYAFYKHRYQSVNSDSTKAWMKFKEDTVWTSLSIDSIAEDPRSGILYRSELSFPDCDSGYVEIMIRSVDQSGNSIEQLFRPAFMVRNISTPIANDDELSGYMNKNLSASSIVSNDENPFGATQDLQVILAAEPLHGTVELSSLNSVLYKPDTNFTGNDEFTYSVRNERYQSNEATVSITITDPNTAIPLLDVQSDSWMKCFPNPVSADLYITLYLEEPQKITVQLYDINGQLILSDVLMAADAGITQFSIPASHLRAGAYFQGIFLLKVITEETTFSEKVVVH